MKIGIAKVKLGFLITILFAVAGCGGGGGSGSSSGSGTGTSTVNTPTTVTALTVSGTASEGALINGKPVKLKDANGKSSVDATTDSTTGTYSIDVTSLTPPFLVTVTGTNGTYVSLAQSAGTANINPITTTVVALAAGSSDPSAIFAGLTPAQLTNINSNYAAKAALVTASLQTALPTGVKVEDYFVGTITAGKGMDAVFDTYRITIHPTDGVTIKTKDASAITVLSIPAATVTANTTQALPTVTLPSGGGSGTSTPTTSTAPIESGSASAPYKESTLMAAGNLNPNGFVQSSGTGRILDMHLSTFSAALFLSNSDGVTQTVKALGNAYYTFTSLIGVVSNYSLPDTTNSTIPLNVTSSGFQNIWVTSAVLNAWGLGWNGANVNVAILDDFTVNDSSEIETLSYPSTSCMNVYLTSTLYTYYCPSKYSYVYGQTHGQQVAQIISGYQNSMNEYFLSSGYYYNPTTKLIAGTLSASLPVSVTFSTPIYGVAYGANSTTKRDDYLTFKQNTKGLFNQLQIWGVATDTTSISYRKSQVVNLSIGGTSKIPTINTRTYAIQRAYADGSTVPDAVFVKAAGNFACSISSTTCDPDNAVMYNSSNYKNKTLIVGALTAAGGTIASYSNRAGSYSDKFVVADGRGYRNSDGTYDEGTSFAAPRVSGYVAILRQKYPNLTAEDAAAIILATAKWNTAWGDKNATNQAIYGQGEADLSRALSAIGSLP